MQLQVGAIISCFLLLASHHVNSADERVPVSGTYSNLGYNEESGDVNGIEVKITPLAGNRMQAAVLISTGEPARFFLATVQADGRQVRIEGRQADGHRWSFEGTVTMRELVGMVKEDRAPDHRVRLPRQCGYWDRAR